MAAAMTLFLRSLPQAARRFSIYFIQPCKSLEAAIGQQV
jgi:hypothetical protein